MNRPARSTGSTILVTGATGKIGRRLIPLLLRRGITVRAASRSPVAARPAVEPVRFDWTDENTYETGDQFDHDAAKGFIRLHGLSQQTQANIQLLRDGSGFELPGLLRHEK